MMSAMERNAPASFWGRIQPPSNTRPSRKNCVRGESEKIKPGLRAQARPTDLRLATHVDTVGVAVLLDVVHPVNVGLQLRIDCGYAGSADELRDVTQTK